MYRSVKKRTTIYTLSDIEAISFFYGRVQKGALRYYCYFKIGRKWSGKQLFSILKSDVEKEKGAMYIQFVSQFVAKVRSENPDLQLQYGQTPTDSFLLILFAVLSLSIPIILHIGIRDSQATAIFSLIIIPLAGFLVWSAFRKRLRTVLLGETIPKSVFPGNVDILK